MPEILIKKDLFQKGVNVIDLLHDAKIMTSKSEARRAVKSGGIKINDKILSNEKTSISLDFFRNNRIKVSHGKKKHFIIKTI